MSELTHIKQFVKRVFYEIDCMVEDDEPVEDGENIHPFGDDEAVELG